MAWWTILMAATFVLLVLLSMTSFRPNTSMGQIIAGSAAISLGLVLFVTLGGAIFLGMVSARPHSAERGLVLATHHRLDGGNVGAGSMASRLQAIRAHMGIRVEADPALRRRAGLDHLDIGGVMDAFDLRITGGGRLGPRQGGKRRRGQHLVHHLDPRHPLRMTRRRDVGVAGRVGEDQD